MIIECNENDFYLNASKEQKEIIMSMRELVARKNSNIIFGNGISFNSTNESLLKKYRELDRYTDFNSFFHFVEKELSLKGMCIITMVKDEGGRIRLNIPQTRFFNSVARVFYEENLAVVYSVFVIDTKQYIAKGVYDKEKVEFFFYYGNGGDNNTTNAQAVTDLGVIKELEKELEVKTLWVHNLGFVPLIQMFNLPFRQQIYSPTQFIRLADWIPATYLEPIACSVVANLKKELEYNHTRIGVENASQEIIEQLQSSNRGSVRTGVFSDFVFETNVGATMSVIPGVSDLGQYTRTLEEINNFYFRYCGLSQLSMSGGAQKTSAETSMSTAQTTETIQMKINTRKRDIEMLFAKIFSFYGLLDFEGDWDFNFEIKGNIQKDETTYIDGLIKQVQSGFMSVPEAIAELRSIGVEKAKLIFEEINSFNEENNIMVTNQMNENDMAFGEEMSSEGGAPEKKLDKGAKSNE